MGLLYKNYAEIKSKVRADSIGVYHLIDFKDWKKTKDTIVSLKLALEDSYKVNLPQNNKEMANIFIVVSRY